MNKDKIYAYIEDLEDKAKLSDKYFIERNELYIENQQLKKQQDDVVEYIKEHLTDNGRFLMLNEWQVPDLLRMLGEIDDN